MCEIGNCSRKGAYNKAEIKTKQTLTKQMLCATIIKLSRHPYRGVEQLEARRAHNPEVVGSSPASATRKNPHPSGWGFLFGCDSWLRSYHPGYESDERSSLGERGERRLWREERPERVAGVGEGRRRTVAKDIRRAPQQGRYAEQILGNVRHKDKTESCRPSRFLCHSGFIEPAFTGGYKP